MIKIKWRNTFKINKRNIETNVAENGYITMGARTYCQDIGRFLQPDPLFEAFARHTPYHYSYNSPLVWLDPSGLAPEKEKGEERLLEYENLLNFEEGDYVYMRGFTQRRMASVIREAEYQLAKIRFEKFVDEFQEELAKRGGGSGSAVTFSFEGISFDETPDGGITNLVYNFTVGIQTSNGTFTIRTRIHESAISPGQTYQKVMDAFAGGINDILSADPTYFDKLTGKSMDVNIMSDAETAREYNKNPANGETLSTLPGFYSGKDNEIFFSSDYLMGIIQMKYFGIDNKAYPEEQIMPIFGIIAHEFAHAIHYDILSENNASGRSSDALEHFARKKTNNILQLRGKPTEFGVKYFNLSKALIGNIFTTYYWKGY